MNTKCNRLKLPVLFFHFYDFGIMLVNFLNFTNSSINLIQKKSNSNYRKWDVLDVILLILFIISFFGNSLIIIVMRNVHMKNTNAALFMSSIAFADIFVLFFKFLASMFRIYKIRISKMCILVQIIPEISAMISYWIIITTTLERCTAVLYPLEVASIFSRKRCALIVISIIIFFIFIVNTRALCLRFDTEKTYFCPTKAENSMCSFYVNYVYTWIKAAFMSWFPSIIGIILNTKIIKELFKASKTRRLISHLNTLKLARIKADDKIECSLKSQKINKHKKKSKSKEKQITIMLCTISITFLIFTLPYTVCEILRKMNSNMKNLIDRYAQRVITFPLDLLHAYNFFLYYLSSEKFRHAFSQVSFRFSKKKDTAEFLDISLSSSKK
jgi:hypothetical protein